MIILLSPANSQCEFAPNSQYCEFQAEFPANSRCERIRSEFGEFKLNSLRICIPRITMLYNTIQYNTIQYNVVLAWCERTLCVLFDDLRRAMPLVGVFAFNCFNLFNSICSIQFVQFNLFNSICSIQFVSICSIQLFNSIQFAIASNLGDKQWYTPYMCM